MLNCGVCGKSLELLTKAHVGIRHGLTGDEYLAKYPHHAEGALWGLARPIKTGMPSPRNSKLWAVKGEQ